MIPSRKFVFGRKPFGFSLLVDRERSARTVAVRRRVAGGFLPPSAAEQREDREHAAVVVLRVGQAELLEDPLHVALQRP